MHTIGWARTARGLLAAASLLAIGAGGHAMAQGARAASAQAQSSRDPVAERRMKISQSFTVAAVGDIIEPQPIHNNDPGYQQLIDRIRKADVGFANMESSLVDFAHFQGPIGGTEAPIEMGDVLKAMGVTVVNRANNHTYDGGVWGMVSTDEALDKLGIVHAGTGRNLQEARGPRYADTPKGRVGLVGMFSVDDVSNYGPSYARTEATARNGDLGGNPGLNPLHLTTYHVVPPDQLHALQQFAATTYHASGERTPPAAGAPERFKFFDEWYEAGTDVGALHYDMNPRDEAAILESVRNGKTYADFMIVTIHAHQSASFESQGLGGVEHQPANFLVKLAHDSIDNGADMFVAHGMHALHGVEIYKGKPIFYGVSNFVFQFGIQFGATYDVIANEKNMSQFENPASQVAVLTTSRFENGKLAEVRLYPVDLGGAKRPISQMGIPMTPAPADAQKILQDLQAYSAPFGTKIVIEDNVGVIRIAGN